MPPHIPPHHTVVVLLLLSFRLILRNVFTTDERTTTEAGEAGEKNSNPFFRKVRTHNVRKPETPECALSVSQSARQADPLPTSCVRSLTQLVVSL